MFSALFSTDAKAANLIVNGEFENTGTTTPNGAFGIIPNWINSVESGTIEVWTQGRFSSPSLGSDGFAIGKHIELVGNVLGGNISQTLTLGPTVGSSTSYLEFSFDAWSRGGAGGTYDIFNVTTNLSLISGPQNMLINTTSWTNNAATITRGFSGNDTLLFVFTPTGGTANSAHIDQVALNASAVPEPTGTILSGLGLLGLLAHRRR